MLVCLKIMYDVLNQITLNCTMRSLTKACTAKLSCEFSTLLRYYAALNCNSLPTFQDSLSTFQDSLSVLSSRVNKPKETS